MGILYCFSLFLPAPSLSFTSASRIHNSRSYLSFVVLHPPRGANMHVSLGLLSMVWTCLGFSEVSAQLLSSQAPTSEPANEPLSRQFGQRVTKGLGPDLFWQEIWHFAGEFPNHYEKSQSLRTS